MTQRRIWSTRRQVLGNIVPVLLGVAVAVICFPFGLMVQAVAGIIATWVGIDRFGFFENKKIDQELRARTGAEGELIGFVYRRPPTIYDAHAEIGLLRVTPKAILVVTEDESIEFDRADIIESYREKNIHSILLLGGWLVLKLSSGELLKLESRKFNSMMVSSMRTNALQDKVKTSKREKAPA